MKEPFAKFRAYFLGMKRNQIDDDVEEIEDYETLSDSQDEYYSSFPEKLEDEETVFSAHLARRASERPNRRTEKPTEVVRSMEDTRQGQIRRMEAEMKKALKESEVGIS